MVSETRSSTITLFLIQQVASGYLVRARRMLARFPARLSARDELNPRGGLDTSLQMSSWLFDLVEQMKLVSF